MQVLITKILICFIVLFCVILWFFVLTDDDSVVSFRFKRSFGMIGRTVRNVYLEGNVRKAFAAYCKRHGIKKAAEGLCLMIRELLPEYKALTEIPEPPTKIPDSEKLSDSTSQPAVG